MNIDASACTVRAGLSSGTQRGPGAPKIAAPRSSASMPTTRERICPASQLRTSSTTSGERCAGTCQAECTERTAVEGVGHEPGGAQVTRPASTWRSRPTTWSARCRSPGGRPSPAATPRDGGPRPRPRSMTPSLAVGRSTWLSSSVTQQRPGSSAPRWASTSWSTSTVPVSGSQSPGTATGPHGVDSPTVHVPPRRTRAPSGDGRSAPRGCGCERRRRCRAGATIAPGSPNRPVATSTRPARQVRRCSAWTTTRTRAVGAQPARDAARVAEVADQLLAVGQADAGEGDTAERAGQRVAEGGERTAHVLHRGVAGDQRPAAVVVLVEHRGTWIPAQRADLGGVRRRRRPEATGHVDPGDHGDVRQVAVGHRQVLEGHRCPAPMTRTCCRHGGDGRGRVRAARTGWRRSGRRCAASSRPSSPRPRDATAAATAARRTASGRSTAGCARRRRLQQVGAARPGPFVAPVRWAVLEAQRARLVEAASAR